jgi:hypothetical protein
MATILVALVACEDALGIDGQFSSVPEAFCTTAANVCSGASLVPSTCEQGISNTLATGAQYEMCAQADAGCLAFVACLDHAVGGCTTNDTTVGLPCVFPDGGVNPCCAPNRCTVLGGGVGVCQ